MWNSSRNRRNHIFNGYMYWTTYETTTKDAMTNDAMTIDNMTNGQMTSVRMTYDQPILMWLNELYDGTNDQTTSVTEWLMM